MNEIHTSTATKEIARQPGPVKTNETSLPGWRNILVPVDLTELSGASLHTAAALAEALGAKLTLLYVVHLPVSCCMDAAVDADDLLCSGRDSLERISGTIPPALIRQKLVQFGKEDIYHEIMDVAEDLPADLIVVAAHEHGALARAFHAGVAAKIIHHAACPVLVVHSQKVP